MGTNAETEKKEKGFVAHFCFWFAVPFGVVALYVLSIGPVGKIIYLSGPRSVPLFEQFYSPLAYVCRRSQLADAFVNWYLRDLWRVRRTDVPWWRACMSGDAEMEKKEKGFVAHVITWVMMIFCLFVLYVLSVGPVLRLMLASGRPMQISTINLYESFYAPLNWLCQHNTFAKWFVTWYVQQLWGIRWWRIGMLEDAQMEKTEKGFVAHLFTWFAVVFIAASLYVLSAAPAAKLVWMNDKKGSSILLVFYAPLTWATDNVPFFNHCFGWYAKLWHIEEW
jgi:hypothetical protein